MKPKIDLWEKIAKILIEAKKVIILPHVDADGDALGSSFALGLALYDKGKEVKIVLGEDMEKVYSSLPGRHLISKPENTFPDGATAVAIDTGDTERLGSRVSLFNNADVTVNIDHHITNTDFAQNNLVITECSAAGEIIFHLLKKMDSEITRDIAECLYIAISTDTGGFRYSNTTADTFFIAARLASKGIDIAEISKRVFETITLQKLRLRAEAVNNLELVAGGKVAVVTLRRSLFEKLGTRDEEADGIVNIARTIEGVEVSVLFTETATGKIKVNFRSNDYVDVSEIASYFSGGGHVRAAGSTMEGKLETVREAVVARILEYVRDTGEK